MTENSAEEEPKDVYYTVSFDTGGVAEVSSQSVKSWNDYNYIILYLKSYPTLSYGVYKMSLEKVNGIDHATMRIASSFLVAVPIFVLFVLFKDKIMGNLTMGGVKE